MSVVHERPSVHVDAVTHAAAALHAPQPATMPSSQVVPVRGVHAVVLVAVLHHRHPLLGSTVAFE